MRPHEKTVTCDGSAVRRVGCSRLVGLATIFATPTHCPTAKASVFHFPPSVWQGQGSQLKRPNVAVRPTRRHRQPHVWQHDQQPHATATDTCRRCERYVATPSVQWGSQPVGPLG